MDFVIGHPRSGTMYASRLLETARLGVSVHELLFTYTWDAVSLPTEYYAGRADADAVSRLLANYERRDPWVRIDSNWKLTWILPVLLERFPRARVLHLVRDPRHVIRSSCDLGYYGTPGPASDDPARRRNFWLSWMPPIRVEGWDKLSQFERNCAFWSESQRLAAEAQSMGARYRRLRIEDLQAAELLDFFALPPANPEWLAALGAAGPINVKAHEKRDRRHLWDEAAFQRICGETARALGYR